MDVTPARTAVVTGGGTSLGRAIATSFAADGWRAVVIGRGQAVLTEVASSQQGVVPMRGDVSGPDDVEPVAVQIVDELGTVDVLVANAGGTHHDEQSTVAQVADHWNPTMSQNVLSAAPIEHAVRPHLRRPCGRVHRDQLVRRSVARRQTRRTPPARRP